MMFYSNIFLSSKLELSERLNIVCFSPKFELFNPFLIVEVIFNLMIIEIPFEDIYLFLKSLSITKNALIIRTCGPSSPKVPRSPGIPDSPGSPGFPSVPLHPSKPFNPGGPAGPTYP